MSENGYESMRKKVQAVLSKRLGEFPDCDPSSPASKIRQEAIHRAFADQMSEAEVREFAFHLTDWAWELEFLVAFFCEPEQFTDAEVEDGITSFLLHAPAHINRAAKISGDHELTEIFEAEAELGDGLA
jgi:hypothetical protein